MTEDELREKIVAFLVAFAEDCNLEEGKELWRKWNAALNEPQWADGQHHGDCTQEPITCARCLVEQLYVRADQFIDLVKSAGWVRLAKDQSLPVYDPSEAMRPDDSSWLSGWMRSAGKKAQQDMLAAGWRKVELSDDR